MDAIERVDVALMDVEGARAKGIVRTRLHPLPVALELRLTSIPARCCDLTPSEKKAMATITTDFQLRNLRRVRSRPSASRYAMP